MICRILGVPLEDEPQFHAWATDLVESIAEQTEEQRRWRDQARGDLNQYMAGLIERHRAHPGDDLLSRMATDTGPSGRMADPYLVETAGLLLVAGHETTVNLIGNGMLTLLRHPATFDRLQNEPDLMPATVEEVLRYEPPVQFLTQRTTFGEIAFTELLRRLEQPRLGVDPPLYRPSPLLRGPEHLLIAVEGMRES